MHDQNTTVSLGFTTEPVPAGTHICQIYTDDAERNDALVQFLLSGLQANERAACFSEKIDDTGMDAILAENRMSYAELSQRGTLTLSGTAEAYFQDNRFDPDRMLNLLAEFYRDSRTAGYSAARVIGEMTPEVQQVPGGDRLLEYESRVSLLLRECPVTSVCQYDAHAFDGATIMDVLKVHPMMMVGGTVIQNPFFIPPETYLR